VSDPRPRVRRHGRGRDAGRPLRRLLRASNRPLRAREGAGRLTMARPVAASAAVPERGRPISSGFANGAAAAVRRSVTSVPKRRGWLVRRMLALADVVGLTTAFALAELLVNESGRTGAWSGTAELLLFVVT